MRLREGVGIPSTRPIARQTPDSDERQGSDAALTTALARDLSDGFELLVLAWQGRLYAFALRMCGRPADAEELTQETFIRAWRALNEYSPDRRRALRVRPWLFQIAVNLMRNHVRDLSRQGTVSLDIPTGGEELEDAGRSLSPAAWLADQDPEGAPEEWLDRQQRLESLASLLLTLPEAHRAAIILRHVEGMSYDAIASVMGVPIGTVKSYASRGAAELRRAIEREDTRQAYREESELMR